MLPYIFAELLEAPHLAVEKYGIPLAVDAAPANVHDTKGIVPVQREIAFILILSRRLKRLLTQAAPA